MRRGRAPRSANNFAEPRVCLVLSTTIVLALTAITAPAWLLLGPPSHERRTPVAGVIDACQEGIRRGSLGAVGFAAAGILLVWGASIVVSTLVTAAKTATFAMRAARALSQISREVEVFADGRALSVRMLPGASAEAFTAGLLRPRVYIGVSLLRELDADEFEAVLLHELAHVRRRDPLRCWLVQTIAGSIPWPGLRSLPAIHRATREAEADQFAIQRMGNSTSLLRALRRVDAVPVAAGLSPLTTERERELRVLRQPTDGAAPISRLALLSGASLFVLLLLTATIGLSDWQSFWLCPNGTTMAT